MEIDGGCKVALIKCPECNNLISEYANNCPHCGCPRAMFEKLRKEQEDITRMNDDVVNCEEERKEQPLPVAIFTEEEKRQEFERRKKARAEEERLEREEREKEALKAYREKIKRLRETIVIKKGDDVEVQNTKNKFYYTLRNVTEHDGVIGLRLEDKYTYRNSVFKIVNIRVNNVNDGLASMLPKGYNIKGNGYSGATRVRNDSAPWIL